MPVAGEANLPGLGTVWSSGAASAVPLVGVGVSPVVLGFGADVCAALLALHRPAQPLRRDAQYPSDTGGSWLERLCPLGVSPYRIILRPDSSK